MVELSRALACAPRILLLDEPRRLNSGEVDQLATGYRASRKHGLAVVLSSNMSMVMRLAERIVVLNFGCRIGKAHVRNSGGSGVLSPISARVTSMLACNDLVVAHDDVVACRAYAVGAPERPSR